MSGTKFVTCLGFLVGLGEHLVQVCIRPSVHPFGV